MGRKSNNPVTSFFSKFFTQKTYSDLAAIIKRSQGDGYDNLKTSNKEQLSSYRSWVFSCISLISNRASSVSFSFHNSMTGEELTPSNKGYKVFTKPFFKPNDLMSFKFIKSFCQIQLDLCGMACIYKARNKLGQVWELWPMNMGDFVRVNVDNSDFLNPTITYIFQINNKMIEFAHDELLVLKYPHPTDIWRAMSPIQAQAYASDIDTYIEVYERDFFKNSARVDMLLSSDDDIDSDKAAEIKARWKEKFAGHFHDIAVLGSGLKPVPMNFSNKDFEFLALADWSKSKIVSAYQIPLGKIGASSSNRAESVTADISFNRECVQPRIALWDEELTREVLHSFDPRIEIKHKNPIPRDRDLEVKEARTYVSGQPVMSLNEFRKKTLDLPEAEGGDEILVNYKGSLIPLSMLNKFIERDLSSQQETDDDTTSDDNGDSATDPTRHDDDDPKVNPDGTDDRDEAPTDGRSLNIPTNVKSTLGEFSFLEVRSRKLWNEMIMNVLRNSDHENLKENIKNAYKTLLLLTSSSLLSYFEEKTVDDIDQNDWILPISEAAALEYTTTIFRDEKWKDQDWNIYVKTQFDSNPRLSKITNTLLKAGINYSKYLILTRKKQDIKWVVDSNECGHRGRIEKNVVEYGHTFEIGKTKMRFPNETLNFSCDCTID